MEQDVTYSNPVLNTGDESIVCSSPETHSCVRTGKGGAVAELFTAGMFLMKWDKHGSTGKTLATVFLCEMSLVLPSFILCLFSLLIPNKAWSTPLRGDERMRVTAEVGYTKRQRAAPRGDPRCGRSWAESPPWTVNTTPMRPA